PGHGSDNRVVRRLRDREKDLTPSRKVRDRIDRRCHCARGLDPLFGAGRLHSHDELGYSRRCGDGTIARRADDPGNSARSAADQGTSGYLLGLVASFWIGNIMLVLLNVPLIGIWVKLLTIPYKYLYPSTLFFVSIGVYAANNDMFQVGETV